MTQFTELDRMTLANKMLTSAVTMYQNSIDQLKAKNSSEMGKSPVPKSKKEVVVRYIHLPNSNPKEGATGMTVAYARNEQNLIFSWAYCIGDDVYSKAVGRERASKNLHDSGVLQAIIDGNELSSHMNVSRLGCIHIDDFDQIIDISSILSDDILENMNFMHFKHAFLTRVIENTILSYIDMYQ